MALREMLVVMGFNSQSGDPQLVPHAPPPCSLAENLDPHTKHLNLNSNHLTSNQPPACTADTPRAPSQNQFDQTAPTPDFKLLFIPNCKPVSLKLWQEDVPSPQINSIETQSIWVKLFNVPLRLWFPKGLSYVASAIGKPLFVDAITQSIDRIDYVLVCVELNLHSPLPSSFTVRTNNNKKVQVTAQYPHKPSICTHCKVFGHATDQCTRRVDDLGPSANSGKDQSDQSWQLIIRRKNNHPSSQCHPIPNPFPAPTNSSRVDEASTSHTSKLALITQSELSPNGEVQPQPHPAHEESQPHSADPRSTPTTKYSTKFKDGCVVPTKSIPISNSFGSLGMNDTIEEQESPAEDDHFSEEEDDIVSVSNHKNYDPAYSPILNKALKSRKPNQGKHSKAKTKICQENVVVVHRNIAPTWSIVCNYQYSTLGRVWILWNPMLVSIFPTFMNGQVINCSVWIHSLNTKCLASFVYGVNTAVQRVALWRALHFHNDPGEPWILMGDFNVLLHVNESFGGANRWTQGMLDFKDCSHKNELEDLRFTGIQFTWTNNSFGCANISRKLDRVLVNYAWMNRFAQATCEFLPHGVSDHSPMLVVLGEISPRKNLPFRFFNFWVLNEKFIDIVFHGWQKEVFGTKMFCVVQKLRALKYPLKLLNKIAFGSISQKVDTCRKELSQCQANLDLNPANDHLRSQEKELAAKFSELCLVEEIFYKQKAQIHWLKVGDQNTSFFMKSFSSKANRRKVVSIKDSLGNTVQGLDLRNEFLNYFQNLLGQSYSSYPGMSSFSNIITKTIPSSLIPIFTAIPTYMEIQKTMLSFNPYKSPGPNGFNSCFFTHAWPIIGQDITEAIQDFFISGRLLSEINCSYIALVLKTPNPSSGKRGVRQGDPISPLLFVLAMEVMSLSLANAISTNPCFKYHWRCSKFSISHLAFADDLLLFSFGNVALVQVLHNALSNFLLISGLSINCSKSQVFFSGVDG
ncbi:uncharacterized protein LOC132305316 [Cornus florida]|uniref:uncharacterized protein LOC132305316 n=1 Tax=Cornus florida TaxID=4283 RepID=UPI00289DDEC8|nr:uncharacterized protein LOC132305316 [Cornus florida]